MGDHHGKHASAEAVEGTRKDNGAKKAQSSSKDSATTVPGAQTMADTNKNNEASTKKELEGTNFSRAEADAYGKSLRDKAGRSSHAGWLAPAGRRDPVDMLIEITKDLQASLLPIRFGRMLQSSFTFFRGAPAIMAADLATTPSTGLYVQACGDCHLINFGAFATPERAIIFDINDFDETCPAPWEWDLKRLATSFVIASQHNKFSNSDAKKAATHCIESYRKHTAKYAEMDPLQIWYSHISVDDINEITKNNEVRERLARRIEKAKGKAAADFPKLTEAKYGKVSIKDAPPLIYHRTDMEQEVLNKAVEEAFQQYFKRLGDEKKILLDQYKFQDVATKIVGVGSVGTRCAISLRMTANNEPLILQAKEARASVLEPYAGKSVYENHAQRVVVGQKLMQAVSDIFLGWTDEVVGAQFYIRQLHDMKIKPLVDVFDEETMILYAHLCGWALARAHARSGKAAIINGYLGDSDKFDDAIAEFAMEYAVQNDRDYATFKKAVKDGKLEVFIEEEA